MGKHSILGKSEFGLWDAACCLPELVSKARCNKPAWSEILFAWASPLPEREAWWRLWKESLGKGHVCHSQSDGSLAAKET